MRDPGSGDSPHHTETITAMTTLRQLWRIDAGHGDQPRSFVAVRGPQGAAAEDHR
jgi:hypothetical protein